ncbi:MAG: hypothetical protein QM680_14765 [Luteolibacter sp.]
MSTGARRSAYERTAREADRKTWETKWSEEHEKNLAAREADRETRERFADAVEKLADAVGKSTK